MVTITDEATLGPPLAKKPFSSGNFRDGSHAATRTHESCHFIHVETWYEVNNLAMPGIEQAEIVSNRETVRFT